MRPYIVCHMMSLLDGLAMDVPPVKLMLLEVERVGDTIWARYKCYSDSRCYEDYDAGGKNNVTAIVIDLKELILLL